jgi:hypothetical protein
VHSPFPQKKSCAVSIPRHLGKIRESMAAFVS